jgi:hypothetical protein
VSGTILKVDVVESDGCRSNHPHTTTLEQRLVATCASAYDEQVGVGYLAGRKVASVDVEHLGEGFQNPFNIGNCTVNYSLHMVYVVIFHDKYM